MGGGGRGVRLSVSGEGHCPAHVGLYVSVRARAFEGVWGGGGGE